MRVAQRLDYALRALTALAQRAPGDTVAARELARELSLPRRFVEQQMTLLAACGLVESRRGPDGGVKLRRPPTEISVRDVLVALQGGVLDVPRVTGSAVSEMWVDAASELEGVFARVTLGDLAGRQSELDGAAGGMYHI